MRATRRDKDDFLRDGERYSLGVYIYMICINRGSSLYDFPVNVLCFFYIFYESVVTKRVLIKGRPATRKAYH